MTKTRNASATPSIRVIHVVSPAFGHTFKGPTRRLMRLFEEWALPDIAISVWGSSFFDQSVEDRKLWDNPIKQTRRVRLLWSIQLLWMLIRQRHNYDLVHVHNLWWGGLLTPLLAHLLGKKTVFHMTLLGSSDPSSLRSQSLGFLKEALLRRYDGMIGVSPALIEDCKAHHYKSKLLTLLNPLTLHNVPERQHSHTARICKQLGIPESAQVLLFVGSIIARKGVDLLLDLFINLSSQRQDVWLILVGANSHKENPRMDAIFVEKMRNKLEQASVDEQVIWTGLVFDEEKLIDIYLASDIFVFPSRAEGMPNVVLEAMNCELPVICSHLRGGTDMMVIPDETGYLVNVDDLDRFMTKTEQLLNDSALRQKMGKAGRQRAITNFGFESYCNKLTHFYHLIADNTNIEAPLGKFNTPAK